MTSPDPLRRRVEDASVPWLERVGRLPRLLVALVVGGGVVAGLVVSSRWSALALLPAVAFLGWLSYLAWPVLGRTQRAVRMVVLGLLLAWAASRLVTG